VKEEVRTIQVETGGQRRSIAYRGGSSDEKAILQVFSGHQYDFRPLKRFLELTALLSRNFEKGKRPLIIDAGANIGAASVFFAGAYPSARIIAIEPEEGNFELLAQNVQGLDVKCLRAALASVPGISKVMSGAGGYWAFTTSPAEQPEGGVPNTTLNSILEAELTSDLFPFIAKIDIEGAEADVFSANTEWIQRVPLIVVELHDWLFPKKGTAASFIRRMSEAERDFILYGESVLSMKYDV